MQLVKQKQYIGGAAAVNPEHVVYVSPNFPNVFPFYSTLQTAHANCPTTSMIHVFAGSYDMGLNLKRTMYCEPGVALSDGSAQKFLNLDISSRLYGYAKFVFSQAGSGITISYPDNSGETTKVFECDSIEYSGSATRDTSGAIYVYGGPYSGQCTIRVRGLNSRVYHSCPSALGQYDINARLNIDCDYIYQFYQQYQSDSQLLPHSIIRCKEFHYVEIQQGTCVVDFAINHSLDPAARVRRQSSLTLRNGTIFADGTSTDYNAQLECLSQYDKPVLRLEQVSMYNAKGCNVQMASLAGTWAKLIIKNCTFVADANSLGNIVGDNATTCHVINGAGNSSGNVGLNLVTEYVNSMLFDPALEV